MTDTVVRASRFPFVETVARVKDAISRSGAKLFAEIDQAAAAASVGLTLRPTTLLIFGNPKAGTALMEAVPLIALDLPLRIVIWEDAAVVSVAYTPAAAIARRYESSGNAAIVAAIDGALSEIVSAVL
jgi:uncharacterized protein (DUF302 family)